MANKIIKFNTKVIHNNNVYLKISDVAKDIIKEERARRKGRPRKEEGGTKENEQKEQTSNK